MAMTIGDVVLELFGDADQAHEEFFAASTAELDRLEAQNKAALERISISDARLEIGSFIQEGLRAIASITTDDIVRYARGVITDFESKKTKDPGEVLLALAAIWLWGGERAMHPTSVPSPQIASSPDVDPQPDSGSIALFRWFASLSPHAQASFLSSFAAFLAQTPTELESLGVWSPPGVTGAHLTFFLTFVAFSYAVVAARRE